jgi:hypothetical protein
VKYDSNRNNDKGRALTVVAVFVILVLPFLYVLSSGPTAWMLSRTEGGAEIWNAVYRPLGLVQGTWLDERLGNYMNWWMPPNPLTTAQEEAFP